MIAQFALGFAISNVIVVLTSSMTFKGVSERAKESEPIAAIAGICEKI